MQYKGVHSGRDRRDNWLIRAGAYPSFYSIERLWNFAPSGWNASPSQLLLLLLSTPATKVKYLARGHKETYGDLGTSSVNAQSTWWIRAEKDCPKRMGILKTWQVEIQEKTYVLLTSHPVPAGYLIWPCTPLHCLFRSDTIHFKWSNKRDAWQPYTTCIQCLHFIGAAAIQDRTSSLL